MAEYMSNTVRIEQVKNYLAQNPPEVIKTRVLDTERAMKSSKDFIFSIVGLCKKDHEYKDTIGRIKELLPNEGDVLLSDFSTTVMIFDENQYKFVKAKYDMNQGQVVPINSEVVELDGFQPSSQLSIEYFDGKHRNGVGKDATASFLETIIGLSNIPLLELGKHKGDSCHRYLPVRKYKQR